MDQIQNQLIDSKGKKILIVEDEADYLNLLTEKLQSEGFIVLQATDGQKAHDLLKKENVDLILMDMLMPQMDGVTFFYHLRNTLNKETPVIVLTNLTETAYPQGVSDFLIKSNTSLDEIVIKVKDHLPITYES